MATIDNLRSGLIDKILNIKNKDLLVALDTLISANADTVKLTAAQKELLKMSEQDIENGRLISQEAMDKRNTEWLSEM